jgi:hypothetical protein
MKPLFDAFWRALAYLFMPRVIGLALLPLILSAGLSLVLGYFFWEDAVAGVRSHLEGWILTEAMLRWLGATLGATFRAVMAPLIVVALALPVVVIVCLLAVTACMSASLVTLVAERRFPLLQRRKGATFWVSLGRALGCTGVAVVALALSAPLWLLPPAALLLPPLIWGWLAMQVMAFDALAEHASRVERVTLMRAHRWPLWFMGVVVGALGTVPSLIWVLSPTALIFFPLLVAVSVGLYTLVFAFSSLWFVHYALTALEARRAATAAALVATESSSN